MELVLLKTFGTAALKIEIEALESLGKSENAFSAQVYLL